jgi:Tfp pilus assembly protein PilV
MTAMDERANTEKLQRGGREQGSTLVETLIAAAILLIVTMGLLSLFSIAAIKNANQGDDATRTVEYANDKMEQLMALEYDRYGNDTDSDTRTWPTCITGNTSSTNVVASCGGTGLAAGGNATIGYAVTGYSDYIFAASGTSNSGIVSINSTGADYTRQWMIQDTDLSNGVKTITVLVYSNHGLAVGAKNGKILDLMPQTRLVAQKAIF